MPPPVGHRLPKEQPADKSHAGDRRKVDDQAACAAETDSQDVVRHHARHEDEKPDDHDRHSELERRARQTAAQFPRRADASLEHLREFAERLRLVAGAVSDSDHAADERRKCVASGGERLGQRIPLRERLRHLLHPRPPRSGNAGHLHLPRPPHVDPRPERDGESTEHVGHHRPRHLTACEHAEEFMFLFAPVAASF